MDSSLKFIILGAGIAGLTAAYLLKEAGHEVAVLEKCPLELNLRNGGLSIPPNATRLFQKLPGAGELLDKKGMKCHGIFFVQCHNQSSELVGQMEFKDELMEDFGSDFYLIPRKDLLAHLRNICTQVGVPVHYGFEVEQILLHKDKKPVVVSRTHEHVTGDIVVAADGKDSVARKNLLAEEETNPGKNSISDEENLDNLTELPLQRNHGVTVSIPGSLIKMDPELSRFTETDHWMLWMGNQTSVVGSWFGPSLYVLNFSLLEMDKGNEDWLSEKTLENTLEFLDEYDPRIKRIFLLGKSHWNAQTVHEPLYVCKNNQLVLIGDAAHAVFIGGAHNTASAIEDAFTLSRVFTKCPTPALYKSLILNGYQTIRQARTRSIELVEMQSLILLGSPPGPHREAKNNGFRATLQMDGPDDQTLAQLWSSYVAQFDYDARDDVDEWWMTWANPVINSL